MVRLKGRWRTPLRYLAQAWDTWHLLERERPEAVIVQAPPVFAPLVVAAWCRLRGRDGPGGTSTPLAVDCHTGMFFDRKWRWALPLLRLATRWADITIVASEAALELLRRWRIRGLFLVDGLPTLPTPSGTIGTMGATRVAIVNSFDADEPLEEVFGAARLLPWVTFYMSGDTRNASAQLLSQRPTNLILTGFVSDGDYSGLLRNVHGLVVLTKDPNVLNCGAYEALAADQPAVLSDWPQLRRYFTRGFVYTANTPEAIAAGVRRMLDGRDGLVAEIAAMRAELIAKRQPNFARLLGALARASVAPERITK